MHKLFDSRDVKILHNVQYVYNLLSYLERGGQQIKYCHCHCHAAIIPPSYYAFIVFDRFIWIAIKNSVQME